MKVNNLLTRFYVNVHKIRYITWYLIKSIVQLLEFLIESLPPTMVEIPDEILFYSQLVASIIGIVIVSIALMYHSITTYLYLNANASYKCQTFGWPSLLICSFLMQIFGIFYSLSGLSEIIWIEYFRINKQICYVHFLLLVIFYGLFKLSLYMALCRRLIESFSESSLYSYSDKFYQFWPWFLVITSLVLIIATCAHIDTSFDPQLMEPCVIDIPYPILIAMVGYDVVILETIMEINGEFI